MKVSFENLLMLNIKYVESNKAKITSPVYPRNIYVIPRLKWAIELAAKTIESLFIFKFIEFFIEYFEMAALIAMNVKFHPRPKRYSPIFKNKIFVLNNVRMQLKQSIKLPLEANSFVPYLSTRFPKIGENKNIPRVW